ncbi:MAG: HNH endonuclease signature motif containing protein [Acidimicrobiaceae bacterium]|nr:HNH endonuclease signature motif containing protein [Acidimicrobiaceae bacterium]
MFSQVRQALDSLAAALDEVDAAPTAELRETLGLAKPLRTKLETLETAMASQIARRERHGDGGAGVLHQLAAVPRSDAARNVRVVAELQQLPEAQSALAEGEMSMANAARLARAARHTSPEAVQGDAELVNLAKTLPPDEFAHASQRWTAKHQSAADLTERHRRNRRNRNVRFWNGEDGTVQMRGAFDAEMGARIQARIRAEAERLRQADRRLQRNRAATNLDDAAAHGAARNGSKGSDAVRTRDQRMADALGRILNHNAPRTTVAPDAVAGGASPPDSASATDATSGGAIGDARSAHRENGSAAHKRPSAQVIVRAELADLLGEHGGIGEIAGTGPVPAGVLDRLCCNADISVVLFGKQLTPLYEAIAARAPTAAQRRALIARDGACIGCGAAPDECEAHHILAWRRGGPTQIDNLVLVCWHCHDRIHDHNWQILFRNGRYRLVPPDATSPPNPAPSKKPTQCSPSGSPRKPERSPEPPSLSQEAALFP